MFAILRPCSVFLSALGLLAVLDLLFGQNAPTKERDANTAPQLYLLAGTPTEHIDKTYPAVLYRAGPDQKLKTVREVVPTTDGLHSVHAWGSVIFIAYPHTIPAAVGIVHTGDPSLRDNLVFNPEAYDALSNPGGFFVSDTRIAVTLARGLYPNALFPLSTNFADPSKGRLANVSSNITLAGQRVKPDGWEEYAALRSEGSAGGPDLPAGLLGSTVGNDLGIVVSGHTTIVAPLPPDLRDTPAFTPIWIVASSADYLVVRRNFTVEELASGKLGDSIQVFLLDRNSGNWRTLRIEGTSSRSRLAGNWLATIVARWNANQLPSPGRDNERGVERDHFPNVRDLYAQFAGKKNLTPGILVLQNLADGRKIRIETGQEDSEILRVEGDVILYRVNDTIYQARIDGSQLKDTTVTVKDEDVPEVHWAFWSK